MDALVLTLRRLEPFRFFFLWYSEGLRGVFRFGSELLGTLWERTAPLLMLRLLFEPLFGDYTWSGLAIGILARLVRASAGFLAISAFLVLWLGLLLSWLLLPPSLLYLFLRNLFFLLS